jgi:hypothetical protein
MYISKSILKVLAAAELVIIVLIVLASGQYFYSKGYDDSIIDGAYVEESEESEESEEYDTADELIESLRLNI